MKSVKKRNQLVLKIVWALLLVQLTACQVGYNSIQYTKSDDALLQKVKSESQRKKYKFNTVFVHFKDTVFQLRNVSYNVEFSAKQLKGELVAIDTNFANVYVVQKESSKGNFFVDDIPNFDKRYLRQTRIFVDSLIVSDASIVIQENQIEKVIMYKVKSKVLLIVSIVLGVGLIVTLIAVGAKLSQLSLG